jgi:hypothetical protein
MYGFLSSLNKFVQRWISANAGLKFNLLFWFVYFCMSVCFKTLGNRTSIDTDKISRKIFPRLQTSCWEDCFDESVNPMKEPILGLIIYLSV